MPRYRFILLLLLLCLAGLTGCGKEVPPAALETTPAALQDMAPQERKTTFDYGPGSLGFYVKASLNIEAGPEVLDSITMTLSDQQKELTRCRVSNRQFDFVKNGHQMGGFLLVDIPRNMLEKPPETWEGFAQVVDHIAKQVMTEVYPSKTHICGGGHIDYGYDLTPYMTFMIEDDNKHEYIHHIYIGEDYIYDFWDDNAWMGDGGETIMSTLFAEDIKPELNQVDCWTIHDFPDMPETTRR